MLQPDDECLGLIFAEDDEVLGKTFSDRNILHWTPGLECPSCEGSQFPRLLHSGSDADYYRGQHSSGRRCHHALV